MIEKSHCPKDLIFSLSKPIQIKTASGYLTVKEEARVSKNMLPIKLRKDVTFKIAPFHPIFNGIYCSDLLRENNAVID